MDIFLTKGGIFPITVDKDNNPLPNSLETGLDIAGTIQGEGMLIGVPSIFIRTTGCNLRCAWRTPEGKTDLCDTPYSSWKPESEKWDVEDLAKTVINNLKLNIRHLVITGGEPMLQKESLIIFLKILKQRVPWLHITLETNGTIFDEEIIEYIDLFSLSPKLSSSSPSKMNLKGSDIEWNNAREKKHDLDRINYKVLQSFINSCYYLTEDGLTARRVDKDYQLKFVVSDQLDITEIKRIVFDHLKGIVSTNVILMPMGSTKEYLERTNKIALINSIKYGWRFTQRVHVEIWGNKKNV